MNRQGLELSQMDMVFVFDRFQPTGVSVTYEFECSKCKAKVEQRVFGQYVLEPTHPGAGWTCIADPVDARYRLWVCPNHKVTVTIEDQPA